MAQMVYRGMNPAEAQDYTKVKAAVLNAFAITAETHCHRLHQEKFSDHP